MKHLTLLWKKAGMAGWFVDSILPHGFAKNSTLTHFALMLLMLVTSAGAWAQTNVKPSSTPTAVTLTESSFSNVDGGNITDLSNIVNGDTGDANSAHLYPNTSPNVQTAGPYYSFVVDLGEEKAIANVNLTWEGAYATEYEIYVAKNSASDVWYKATHVTGNSNANNTITINTVGRYLKVKPITAFNTSWGIKMESMSVTAYPTSTETITGMYLNVPSTGSLGNEINLSYLAYDTDGNVVLNPSEDYKLTVKDPDDAETEVTGKLSYTPTKAGKFTFTYAGPAGMSTGGVVCTVTKDYQKLTLNTNQVWVEEGCNYANADKAFDGNTGSEWKLHDNDEAKAYEAGFIIDLKGTYDISKIEARYDRAGPCDYTISFSSDGETYTTATTKTNIEIGTVDESEVDGTNVLAEYNYTTEGEGVRYVKFHCSKPSQEWGQYGLIIKIFDITAAKVSDATNDADAPTFSTIDTAHDIIANKTSVDLKLTATDASGKYVYYTIQKKTDDTFGTDDGDAITARYTTMESGATATYTISGLTSDNTYYYTITAYDVFGNASTPQNITVTTKGLEIAHVNGTVPKVGAKEGDLKDMAEQAYDTGTSAATPPTFTILDTEGTIVDPEVDTKLKVYYLIVSNDQNIINTTGMSTTNSLVTAAQDAQVNAQNLPYFTTATFGLSGTGTATIRVYAVYTDNAGNVSHTDNTGYYSISLRGNTLKVDEFKVGETTYNNSGAGYSGNSGDLKKLINKALGADDTNWETHEGYLTVTELKVSETLNTIDIRTLRSMGGIKDAEGGAAFGFIRNNDRNTINNYRGKDTYRGDSEVENSKVTSSSTYTTDGGYAYTNTADKAERYTYANRKYTNTEENAYGALKVLDLSNASFRKCEAIATEAEAQTWYETYRYRDGSTTLTIGSQTFEVSTYPTWNDLKTAVTGNYASVTYPTWAVQNDDTRKAYRGALEKTYYDALDYNNIIVSCFGNDKAPYTYYSWGNTGSMYNIQQFFFTGCINLETVTLPTNCQAVGGYAFQFCDGLHQVKNIEVPEIFGMMAFGHCPRLQRGTSDDKENAYITLNANATQINYSAFQNCKTMKLGAGGKYILPNSLNIIGDMAFAGCDQLVNITWPDNSYEEYIQHMTTGVFQDCRGLTDFTVTNDNLYTVGYMAFQGCINLTNFKIAGGGEKSATNLENIVANAFDNCPSMSAASFKQFGNVRLIGEAAFRNCIGLDDDGLAMLLETFQDGTDEKPKDNSIVGINGDTSKNDHILPTSAFDTCTGITKAITNDKTIGISERTFALCSNLKYVNLTSGDFASIGKNAFMDDTKLRRFRVNQSTAPACYINYATEKTVDNVKTYPTENGNPFAGVTPNHVTLEFGDYSAEQDFYDESYITPDASYTVGTEGTEGYKAGNAWLWLLTKTMNEKGNETSYHAPSNKLQGTYEVVEQRHAIVNLTRTMQGSSSGTVNNWNSLVLPFSLDEDQVKKVFGNDAYVAEYGWYASAADQAANRKTYIRNNVMQFQKTNAIVAGKPYVIKVSDTGNKSDYTCNNVNVGLYWASAPTTGVSGLDPAAETLSTEDDGELLKFTGTLDNVVGINSDKNVVYMASSPSQFYYKLKDSNSSLNMKGFRSFFTFGSGSEAKVLSLGTFNMFVDDEVVTSLDGVSLTGETEVRGDIYNVNGQFVRKNATTEGLPRGIYIVNGKKYIVK